MEAPIHQNENVYFNYTILANVTAKLYSIKGQLALADSESQQQLDRMKLGLRRATCSRYVPVRAMSPVRRQPRSEDLH